MPRFTKKNLNKKTSGKSVYEFISGRNNPAWADRIYNNKNIPKDIPKEIKKKKFRKIERKQQVEALNRKVYNSGMKNGKPIDFMSKKTERGIITSLD